MKATTGSIDANGRAVEGPVADIARLAGEEGRWILWIEVAETLSGRDLRSDDWDLNNSLNAYMNGTTAGDYASAVRYPHAVSTGLLYFTMIGCTLGLVVAILFAWRGGR